MRLLILLLLLISFASAETLHIAVASSMRPVLSKVVSMFEKKNKDVHVKLSFGSSGNLYGQILGGAPYDIFISANAVYPEKLVEKGYALKDSYTKFARGRLVIFTIRDLNLSAGLDVLKEVARIVIANPRHAPYGRAAVEVLKRYGIYDELRGKLIYGSNVAQAFQFVVSGGAEAGLVAFSLVKAYGGGNYWIVPSEMHSPIKHVAVITVRGKDKRYAVEFLRFLKDREIQKILKDNGFEVP